MRFWILPNSSLLYKQGEFFTFDQDETKDLLMAVYENKTDKIDLFVAMLLERDNSTGYGPGYIVKKVIEQQLLRLRDADFYWFENTINR